MSHTELRIYCVWLSAYWIVQRVCYATEFIRSVIFLLGIGFSGMAHGMWTQWQRSLCTAYANGSTVYSVHSSCLLLRCDPTIHDQAITQLSHSRHFVALWWKNVQISQPLRFHFFFAPLLLLLMPLSKVFIKYSESGNKERKLLLFFFRHSLHVKRRLNLSATCSDWQVVFSSWPNGIIPNCGSSEENWCRWLWQGGSYAYATIYSATHHGENAVSSSINNEYMWW